MGDDLAKLAFAVGLSRKASRVIRQNLYVSLGVIAFLIVATTTGYFGIGPAPVAGTLRASISSGAGPSDPPRQAAGSMAARRATGSPS